jgi:hypothetical protein
VTPRFFTARGKASQSPDNHQIRSKKLDDSYAPLPIKIYSFSSSPYNLEEPSQQTEVEEPEAQTYRVKTLNKNILVKGEALKPT